MDNGFSYSSFLYPLMVTKVYSIFVILEITNIQQIDRSHFKIDHMKGALQVMKHISEEEEVEVQRKVEAIKLYLKNKEED